MDNSKIAMNTYQWNGVNRQGERINGCIHSSSIILAKTALRKQGVVISKIVKQRRPLFDRTNKKISALDITSFSRQIATLIQAGIPLLQSFEIIAKGQKNQRMKNLIGTIKKAVETGLSLSEALGKHPSFFNSLFCHLVDAGEKSGTLDLMLDKIATYKEKIESIKKKIKKALLYPLAVLVVAFSVTAILLLFVVPQFEALFNDFGAELPALTQIVVNLSNVVRQNYSVIISAIVSCIYAFIYARQRSPHFVASIDGYLLRLPIVGMILQKAIIARFSRTLAITFAAGLPLVDALKSVSGVTGNSVYSKATDSVREEISNGQSMQIAMENTHLFPDMVVQMIAVGEESGTLELMLAKIAHFYEEDVDAAIDSLSSLLEPLIMSILGILAGGLVVAMYLPIFKLGSVI